jgi:hypothetical protein
LAHRAWGKSLAGREIDPSFTQIIRQPQG